MKMIKLIDDFAILPTEMGLPLRHFCSGRNDYSYDAPDQPSGWNKGWPMDEDKISQSLCDNCKGDIPSKVIFMAKLWCLQNGKDLTYIPF